MKTKSLIYFCCTVLLISSCKKELQETSITSIPTQPIPTQPILTQADEQRNEFATILAKAVVDKNVRKLIKEEAAKQFDNDYDVLFELVKDKEVTPGVSLFKYLSELPNGDKLAKINEELPLLTILVPELTNFSVKKWDVDNQVPIVAVVNSNHREKKNAKMIAFNNEGKQYQLETTKEPNIPVIVVKENERIIPGKSAFHSATRGSFVFKNIKDSYYFLDDSFDPIKNSTKTKTKTKTSTAARVGSLFAYSNPKLEQAYNLNAPSQRDYTYYNILGTNDRGPLDYNYSEYITGFGMTNSNALSYTYDDPTSDWSDGAMEFQIDVLFFNGTSALNKVSKVLNLSKFSLTGSSGGTSFLTFGAFSSIKPIMIATWDEQNMGDTWKYVVNELDPGTVTTRTTTVSSKFGGNFTFEITIAKIVKLGLGLTGEQTRTNTTQIQVTSGSDFCGESIVSFPNPIIVDKTSSGFGGYIYYKEELNTGSVRLLVEPRKIGG